MSQTWPTRFLDFLERVDIQEAPHGLYGIQQAHASEGRLPTLAQVFAARAMRETLKQFGFSNPSTSRGYRYVSTDRRPDLLSLSAGPKRLSLQILNHATTKVRHYGSAFRLDKRHVKPSREPSWDLETLVPKLGQDAYETHGILLVAHHVSAREMLEVLGKTADPAFLDRYGLVCHAGGGGDRYGRGFLTALHLWIPRGDDESSATKVRAPE